MKSHAKRVMRERIRSDTSDRTSELAIQGDFLKLLEAEDQDITWKAVIYSVPKGIMAWASRCITDSLATPSNLAKWKRIIDPTCKLCSQSKGTLHHILNSCSMMLDRYKWRHDSILNHLAKELRNSAQCNMKIYADIPNYDINGGTIPANIIETNQRPDLVIIDESSNDIEMKIVELTCPFERNYEAAKVRKEDRYAFLLSDILSKNINCELYTLEIGSRGHINNRNKETLRKILKTTKYKQGNTMLKHLSKLALLGSYSIYNARNDLNWTQVPLICP